MINFIAEDKGNCSSAGCTSEGTIAPAHGYNGGDMFFRAFPPVSYGASSTNKVIKENCFQNLEVLAD
jgi:hypothetical protein